MRKAVVFSGLMAILVGTIVASGATWCDWRINPSGLYHDGDKTHWNIVMETAMSWFLPVTVVVFLLALCVCLMVRHRRPDEERGV